MGVRWRPSLGFIFLIVIGGHLHLPCVLCQADYFDGQIKGDTEGDYSEPRGNANLGFDDVIRRHDGYVKGETASIPKTSFSCSAQPYNPGHYADMETNCQVYHVCFDDRQESFLCGPGTNFNQKILACDFWYNFNCADSAQFYSANSEIGKVPDTVYRPDQSVHGDRRSETPSFPSYPQPVQEPISPGDYIPPRVNVPAPPPPQFQPRPPTPRQPPPPPPPRIRPQPPRIPQPSAQPPSIDYPAPRPLPPVVHQEVDKGYDISIDSNPPQISHPVFPPVISPPRVIRPEIQHPVVIRRPDEPSRPRVPSQHVQVPVHPDAEIKGSDYRPPRPQAPRIPQPSQPAHVYPPRQPQPPIHIQQEHVDVDHVPPPPPRRPPPPRPIQQRPPPPPPPPRPIIQQEVVHPLPPPRPPIQQEVIVHPPPPPRQPQPSVIVSQQQRPSLPPQRDRVHITPRPRVPVQRPQPAFPPTIDHPNANVKGGPGYRQPPPARLPSYDPVRIAHRPSGSSSQSGYLQPPPLVLPPRPPPQPQRIRPQPPAVSIDTRPRVTVKQPAQTHTRPDYVRPLPPSTAISVRPQPIPDHHPDYQIKGTEFTRPRVSQPSVRVVAPATSVTTVKRPQISVEHPRPPTQTTNVKTARPSTDSRVYQPPIPQTPPRARIPPPQPIDHPNISVKGISKPNLPVIISPPSAPSTSINRKTPARRQNTGRDYQPQTPPQRPYIPQGNDGYQQQEVFEPEFLPPPPVSPSISVGVKDTSSIKRPSSSHQTIHVKPSQNDYNTGSNYRRGSENYPKPEFQKQTQPIAVPSRSSQTTRQSSGSQTRVGHQTRGRQPQGSNQIDYPNAQVPGHQPPHERQVFPHRDNPDHPNESIKGTNAYRPPPPANFQSAASEIQEQKAESPIQDAPEQKPDTSSKLGDTGSE